MKTFDPTADISNDEALAIIRDILENGHVIFTPHAREEMKNGNFDTKDIVYILDNGVITSKEFDKQRGNWKYRIKGKDIEGESGIVITAVISKDTQVIVTAF